MAIDLGLFTEALQNFICEPDKLKDAVYHCRKHTGKDPVQLVIPNFEFTFYGIPVVFSNVKNIGYVPNEL